MPVPVDIYENEVDFSLLAFQYPDFAKKLKRNGQLDFSDPGSVLQLTKALLDRDFQLHIDLPDDRLCPPVPNRFNYIRYIQRLLQSTRDTTGDEHDVNRRVVGIDIGTGASAIYPLLACRQNPDWVFLATEIDAKSREYAIKNIASNGLSSRIRIVGDPVMHGETVPWRELEQIEQKIDVLMTNPPFYEDEAEMQNLAAQKSRPPNSVCTGAPTEMVCPGGEVGFISRIFHEARLEDPRKHAIKWYTSTLGKLSSVVALIELLREHECHNYAVTEFVQGHKTRRWCIGWSFHDWRPSVEVARSTNAIEKRLLPWNTSFEFEIPRQAHQVREDIREQVSALSEMEYDDNSGVGRSVHGDIWSRKARRWRQQQQQQQKQKQNEDEPTGRNRDQQYQTEDMKSKDIKLKNQSLESAGARKLSNSTSPIFVFKITVTPSRTNPSTSSINQSISVTAVNTIKSNHTARNESATTTTTTTTIRWLHGSDPRTFDSFCTWLKRGISHSPGEK